MELYDWQKEILDIEGNICLRSGRQVGKSTIIAMKAGQFAVKNPNKKILIIASVERQARLLFEKTLGYLSDNYRSVIKTGKDRPTQHIINLKNGSRIYSLPTGLSGYGIRGYTVDLLIADEANFIFEAVWSAVTPMLAATKGKIILLSTPFGKMGYFSSCFKDPNFKSFHISSEDCPHIDKEFLEREKARMTKAQYAQEYLGEFVDELVQWFSTELIEKSMVLSRSSVPLASAGGDYYLGVDIARMGGDETVLFSMSRQDKELKQFDMEITEKTYLPETIARIKASDRKHNFKKIYIDDGGLGVGVFDPLLQDEQTKRKVVAINNAARSLDRNNTQRKKLMKEDLYTNALWLMEKGAVKLFDDPEIMLSLKSVQYEYTAKNELVISGKYTHIAEAFVRACRCMKDKSLNLWVAS